MKKKMLVLLVLLGLMMTACGSVVQTSNNAVEETESKAEAAKAEETEGAKTSEEVAEEATENKDLKEPVAETEVEETAEKVDDEAAETAEEVTEPAEEAVEEVVAEEAATEEELKEVIEQVTSFEQPKIMYATAAVNVRRGPSTEYEVITHVAMAQQVETTGQAETGWYQIMVDGQPAYVSHKYLSETKVEIAPPAPAVPEQAATQQVAVQPVAEQASAQTAAQPAAAQPAEQPVTPAGIIMVGDSRCVQMNEAVGANGCMWVCENSKEYTWFCEKAIPKFDKYVGKGTKVVINMGVNDPEHYKQYVGTINTKAAEWAQRGATTYLVSVNPVWENPYTTKEEVDTFNANVPGMLIGVNWIDTHTWLVENGYRVLDGLHYDAPTYVNIYNLIMGSL